LINLQIRKPGKPIKASIKLPFSKSESNRALMIKALSDQKTILHNLSDAADTLLLNKCIRMINTCCVSRLPMVVDAKDAGTVFRFLTAYLSILNGKWLLTGCERMQNRPIRILVEALRNIGADITYKGEEGYPPILIEGKQLDGGRINVGANVSSQYITGLLLIAPYLKNGIEIKLVGETFSKPYIDLTIGVMKQFGVIVERSNNVLSVKPQNYTVGSFDMQRDWSAAAFWYEIVAISEDSEILLEGLTLDTLQGDSVLPEIFKNLGVETIVTDSGMLLKKSGDVVSSLSYNFKDCPDLAQAVISSCAALKVSGEFVGLQSLRIKEIDRIQGLNNSIATFGFHLVEKDCKWTLEPVGQMKNLQSLNLSSFGDHRMAMSVAPFALVCDEVCLMESDSVVKSYPHFWEDLKSVGFDIKEI